MLGGGGFDRRRQCASMASKKEGALVEHGEEEGKSGMSYCFSILESWIYLLSNGY